MAPTTRFFKRFIEREESAGVFLLLSTVAALVWANSIWHETYFSFWESWVGASFGALKAGLSLRHFVDEVLMTFFFLIVGCELKRERLEGELVLPSQIKLPLFAALGGMVVPALFFVAVHSVMGGEGRSFLKGWAIPTATDIAFALGILTLLGSRVPSSLKTFLMALAIIDDLGAVVLIGLFYTAELNGTAFAAAAFVVLCLWALNRRGVRSLFPYGLLGVLLWGAVYKSGVHATLSGVILAMFLPLRTQEGGESATRYPSPLKTVEEKLHIWVAYLILPLFALANAGVSLQGVSAKTLASPLTLGIVAGLLFGKQIGVFFVTWLLIRTKQASLPSGARWLHIYGTALLCGIGFTMSLFISGLAFQDQEAIMSSRLGILAGSTLSALAGCAVLYFGANRKKVN